MLRVARSAAVDTGCERGLCEYVAFKERTEWCVRAAGVEVIRDEQVDIVSPF